MVTSKTQLRRIDNLEDARLSIKSRTASEKTQGFAWIRRYFEQHRYDPALASLGHNAIRILYEDLFHIISEDRATFLRYTGAVVAKSTAALRLSEGAAALRSFVTATVSILSKDQASNIINHVMQVLLLPDGGYLPPIELEYLKILRTVLEYQPHAEHLKKTKKRNQWKEVLEFCLDGLHETREQSVSAHSDRQRGTFTSAGNELLGSLRALVVVSNAPLAHSSVEVLNFMLSVLQDISAQSTISVSEGFSSCFTVVRVVINYLSTSRSSAVFNALPTLLTVLSKMLVACNKVTVIREEILMIILILQPQLANLADSGERVQLEQQMANLAEALLDDYVNESSVNKLRLDLDDLDLFIDRRLPLESMPLQYAAFSLRTSNPDAEYYWTQLHLTGFCNVWLDASRLHARTSSAATVEVDDEDGRPIRRSPVKRRRISTRFEALLARIRQVSGSTERIRLLQILCFSVELQTMSIVELGDLMNHLVELAAGRDSQASSWAFLCLSSCLFKRSSSHESLKKQWLDVTQLAMQKVSSPSICRVACHVLKLVLSTGILQYRDIDKGLDSLMSSGSMSGPATLCDSALELWQRVVQLKAKYHPGTGVTSGCYAMLQWICSKWNLNDANDRKATNDSRSLLHSYVSRTLEWLFDPAGDLDFKYVSFPRLEKLGQCWLDIHERSDLSQLLMMLDDNPLIRQDLPKETMHNLPQTRPHADKNLESMLAGYLETEVEKILSSWHDIRSIVLVSQRHQAMLNLFQACSAVLSLRSVLKHTEPEKLEPVFQGLTHVVQLLMDYVCNSVGCGPLKEAIVDGLLALLPSPLCLTAPSAAFARLQDLSGMLALFASKLNVLKRAGSNTNEATSDNALDEVFGEDSQRSRQQEVLEEASSRLFYQALASPQSAHLSSLLYISFLHEICLQPDLAQEKTFPPALIDSLQSLSAEELTQALPLLRLLLDAGLAIKPGHVDMLLQHIAVCYMLAPEEASQLSLSFRSQSLSSNDIYRWDRCESAISLCVMVMTGTAQHWSESDLESLNAIGEAIYLWLYDLTSRESEVSSVVKMHFVDLLYDLLDVKSDYTDSIDDVPSIRTTLFNLLQSATIEVRHKVATRLRTVFQPFAASQHEQIMTDIHGILPDDDKWVEGMAVRMYVFMTLGSALKSLLRHCFCHIVETASLVRASTSQASKALGYMARAAGLKTAQDLLHVLKSQLLYTWLVSSSYSLESLPYSVFEYSSLVEMLVDLRIDVVSILTMCGPEANGDQTLNKYLSLTNSALQPLLEESFPRALAYCLARDITSPASGTSASNECENRLKTSITTARFGQLLLQNYHIVLGHVITRLDREDTIAKYLEKQTGYALNVLNDIKNLSCSNDELPSALQPNFKTKILPHIVSRLRNRLKSQGIDELWSPKLLTAVYRMLFNNLSPILGDQHTIRVVRRIRIVVALSGANSLSNYPLEQVLHGLRPVITDNRCNADAIGVFRYLLDKGRAHLQNRPSFVAGLFIALFLEMLTSMQSVDSADDRNKMQSLHSWLAQYLDKYQPSGLKPQDAKQFRRLIESARRMSEAPNATIGKPESQLLIALLDEKDGRSSLLSGRACSTAFRLFFKHFQAPTSFSNDVLGRDEASTRYASRLWKAAQAAEGDDDFLIWTAKVLGRSFSHSGEIPKDFLIESNLRREKITASLAHGAPGVTGSKVAILHFMLDLLQSDKSRTVGLVEAAIQECLIGYARSQDVECFEQVLPSSLLEAFSLTSQKSKSADRYLRNLTPNDAKPGHGEEANLVSSFTAPQLRTTEDWLCDLVIGLILNLPEEPLFIYLHQLVRTSPDVSSHIFPFVLHLVLQHSIETRSNLRMEMSSHINSCLEQHIEMPVGHLRALIDAILYLRSQAIPGERTSFDRNAWLNVSYNTLAEAALKCNMQRTALLFVEIDRTQKTIGRAPSADREVLPRNLLLSTFQGLEEPDSFYGVHEASTLSSIAERLMHEGNAVQSMLYRGAQLDASVASDKSNALSLQSQLLQAMGQVNMNTIVYDLVSAEIGNTTDVSLVQSMTTSALLLGRWDVSLPPEADSNAAVLYRTLQGVSTSTNIAQAQDHVRVGLLNVGNKLTKKTNIESSISESLATVAALNEIDLVLTATNQKQLANVLAMMTGSEEWMRTGRTKDVSVMLQGRKSLMRIISTNKSLREDLGLKPRDSLLNEANVLLRNSAMFRRLGSFEESLSTVTLLSSTTKALNGEGIKADAAVTYEISNALQDRGELVSSINMLRELDHTCDFGAQDIATSPSEIVATLGRRIADARLEKPVDIVQNYLEPAIKRLEHDNAQAQAGRAYHIFAAYCHEQLSRKEALEDLHRMERFRVARLAEVEVLKQLSRTKTREAQEARKLDLTGKAEKWLGIDDKEYARLKQVREDFIRKSLNCYLECLLCSDEYDTDATRFTALWMEHSDNEIATAEVAQRLARVASRKFAPLMNQLASRLQNSQDPFHKALFQLVERICTEHPFHGMHYMHAGKYTPGGKDPKAISRQQAATALTDRLNKGRDTANLWSRITGIDTLSSRLAAWADKDVHTGTKLGLNELEESKRLFGAVLKYKVPPITRNIAIRADKNYDGVPHIVKYEGEISILGGISRPKLVTEIISDGTKHREIFKGGSDDMRQDAIMEQVFVEATSILKNNKATRQRNLTIRTYNVVPLDANSGVIEFAQNTRPLLDFLDPAHGHYHPNDWTWRVCRKKIEVASKLTPEAKLKVYRDVVAHFSPVLRHFFFENYDDPDTWYERRLAYTRSTAAISILGHVLGLGDRHNQNVLLDQVTGEVVHIDHGVAFEAGRVLPLPELVPFRLTRDIVDGFGVLGTEGVFRRCCEFTLEALRENRDTIMTLLNVLRYDPLHNWSVSPLRARRLQKEQDTSESSAAPTPAASRTGTRRSLGGAAAAPGVSDGGRALDLAAHGRDPHEDEGGQADRALSVVEKKLGKDLSVQAAVNELIQQATDENNLAQLFTGWAAYA